MRSISLLASLSVLAENGYDSVAMLQTSQVSKSVQGHCWWSPARQLGRFTHGDTQFGNQSCAKQITSSNGESKTKQQISEAKFLSTTYNVATGTYKLYMNQKLVTYSKVDLFQHEGLSEWKVQFSIESFHLIESPQDYFDAEPRFKQSYALESDETFSILNPVKESLKTEQFLSCQFVHALLSFATHAYVCELICEFIPSRRYDLLPVVISQRTNFDLFFRNRIRWLVTCRCKNNAFLFLMNVSCMLPVLRFRGGGVAVYLASSEDGNGYSIRISHCNRSHCAQKACAVSSLV